MGNVISLSHVRAAAGGQSQSFPLFRTFAKDRRDPQDVMWLKENAELLNIYQSLDCKTKEGDLESYLPFYEGSSRHMVFFRQYYRFILSICLDLEDLGLTGGKGAQLANWVAKSGVVEAELSDLQRAEAQRLLSRRGLSLPGAEALDRRLRSFMEHSATFAVPNRKAAYELTHVVFYLSEYGHRSPELSANALRSLHYVGIIAFLDQDVDLLSEVCLALVFAGQPVPEFWQSFLKQAQGMLTPSAAMLAPEALDGYHTFFVLNWFLSKVEDSHPFATVKSGNVSFKYAQGLSVLRGVSMALYSHGAAASSGSYAVQTGLMRCISAGLSTSERQVFEQAQLSPHFGCFFDVFARTEKPEPETALPAMHPKNLKKAGVHPTEPAGV